LQACNRGRPHAIYVLQKLPQTVASRHRTTGTVPRAGEPARVEPGARPLADPSQALVRSLIENKLKLETRPFVIAMPENLSYVRGQRFRNSDLANHVNVPGLAGLGPTVTSPGARLSDDLLAGPVGVLP
jgi:hypothetical protein